MKGRLKTMYFERLLMILFLTLGLTACASIGFEMPGQPDGPAAAADEAADETGDEEGKSLLWLWILLGVLFVVIGGIIAFIF